MRARTTQVKYRLEACDDCTSCIIDGTGSARQERTGRVRARGVQRLYQLHHRWWGVYPQSLHKEYSSYIFHFTSIAKRGESPKWRAMFDGMSKIYADNLARSNSNLSRGIAGRGVAIQVTGRDLSNTNFHYFSKFGSYKNDSIDFKVVRQQNQRRRQRQHKQRYGHQPQQLKPEGQQ